MVLFLYMKRSRRYTYWISIAILAIGLAIVLIEKEIWLSDRTETSSVLDPTGINSRLDRPTPNASAIGSLSSPVKPESGYADSIDAVAEAESEIIGVFGTPLVDPWTKYNDNIVLARAGDKDAQFVVSDVLFECKGLPTRKYFAELVDNRRMDSDMAEYVGSKMDICAQLIDQIGQSETDRWQEWLDKAANGGHVVARARRAAFAPYNYTPEEAVAIFRDLLSAESIERTALMVSYFANFREDDHIGYEVWLYLACEENPTCEFENYRGEDQVEFLPSEQQLFDDRLTQIQSAIAESSWNDIQL